MGTTQTKSIIVLVERPDRTTYTQEVEVRPGQTPAQAFKDFQYECLGNPYGWYTDANGRHKYIKKDAYLAITLWWK